MPTPPSPCALAAPTTVCAGGTSRTSAEGVIDPVGAGTTWSYPLNGAADITAIGQGEDVTLRVTARDAAGNPAHGSRVIEVDTTAPVFTSLAANTIAINSPIGVRAYNANATDNGRGTDQGITYTLSGDDALTFTIDADNGIVTYNTVQTAEDTHEITITATDTVGNTAMQEVTIRVRAAPTVTITDNIVAERTANLADGNLTFTFNFSEAVTGFDGSGVTVSGGSQVSLMPTPVAATTYTNTFMFTLVATPTPDINEDTISVTVAEDEATGVTSNLGNAEATASQAYDTLAPTVASAAATADGARIDVTVSEMLTLTDLDTLDGTEFILGGTTSAIVKSVSTTGILLTLVVDPAIQPGDTVMLTWAAGSDDIIADLAGNRLDNFASQFVATDAVVVTVGFDETIENQDYTATAPITPLTLPRATGGSGTLSYTLTPIPDGLAFDAGTRILTGTASTPGTPPAGTAVPLTYTATDAEGVTGELTFEVTVFSAPTPRCHHTQFTGLYRHPDVDVTLPGAMGGVGPVHLRYNAPRHPRRDGDLGTRTGL